VRSYSIDVRSRTRSLLVRLPGEHLDSVDQIAWSPDGAHLAVLNDLEPGGWRLYVTGAGGNDVHVLVDDVESGGIAWSPDGTRLAYAVPAGRRQTQIWTVSADGSAPILVEASDVRGCGGVDICNPVWSPDGAEIAFKTGVGVFVIDADGLGEARRIDELTYLSWRGGSYFCGCYG
jgi:Tol biopolymer transport system component